MSSLIDGKMNWIFDYILHVRHEESDGYLQSIFAGNFFFLQKIEKYENEHRK